MIDIASKSNGTFTYLGIDISKCTLDICILRSSGKPLHAKFANTIEGHQKLLSWSQERSQSASMRFCMEATGSYGQSIATYLSEVGEYVSVVNPARIKYSSANGASNKTDKADALSIAKYAGMHQPGEWTPPTPQMRSFIALKRQKEDLVAERGHIAGRLKDPQLTSRVREHWIKIHDAISAVIAQIDIDIAKLIDDHPDIGTRVELLDTIPGVGLDTAISLLAELPDMEMCPSAESAAAYAGLSPREYRSGTSIHKPTRISKAGNKHLRSCLYFPAISAMTYNPRVRQLAERLRAKGKKGRVIIAAAMRKLVMIAYGVLRSGQPFQAETKMA